MEKKEFNIVITGVGGQGLITLLRILAEATLIEGLDCRTSELHGLSQREGSVITHIRFGKEIFSPLVSPGKADLILGLEIFEALKRVSFANPDTVFLVNKKFLSFPGAPPKKEILGRLENLKNLHLIEGSKICKKEIGKEVLAGVFLLSYACFKNLIPLKPGSILKAIERLIPKKYVELNKRAFDLAKSKI